MSVTGYSDRDLLFGVLALQTDLVDRGTLIEVLSTWVPGRSRPLPEVLVESGALSAAHRGLLEPLVDAQVDRHGGAAEGLASAISASTRLGSDASSGPGQVAILGLLEAASRFDSATLDHRGGAASGARAASPDDPRFRILRPHARGGLGQVFVARDAELGREVALKEIRPEHAGDDAARSRFLLEAEINGNLEHPGIVPVYALGHHADGRPFYAMRFVDGDSLQQAIAAYHREAASLPAAGRSLRLRELLGRFVDVCEAIAYAHSRGVLHRDLKPSNVMLGKFGETLLIDWGLAKATGRADVRSGGGPDDTLVPLSGDSQEPTRAGSAMGTPAYMSPEQARGDLDALGPASDIYGLGATLYALLAGRPPVEGSDLAEVLDKAARGDVRPLRQAAPDVPRPLAAICHKALAHEPVDRYATALDLARDVERWLADEPVSAEREPIAARAWRWVRRHRTATTAALAVGLAVMAATAVAYRREARYAARLDRANRDAERWLDRAMESIRDYYTGISNAALTSGALPDGLKRDLLEKPRRLFEQITDELSHQPDPGVRERTLLADARHGLGMISFSLGRNADARRELNASLVLRRGLRSARPDDAATLDALARTLDGLGIVLREFGDAPAAEAADREAVSIRERLAASAPGDPGARYALVSCYFNLGLQLMDRRDYPASAEVYRKAIAAAESLIAASPRDLRYRNMRAICFSNLGHVLAVLGEHRASGDAQRRAIAELRALVKEAPDDVEHKDRLARAYMRQADWLQADEEPAAAIDPLTRAVALYDEIVAAEPGIPAHRDWLGRASDDLGTALADSGDYSRAIAACRRAVAIARRLVADYPDRPGYRNQLGGTLCNLAIALDGDDRPAEALPVIEEAISVQTSLAESYPKVAAFRDRLPRPRAILCDVRIHLGRFAPAAQAARAYLASGPDDPDILYNAACFLCRCIPLAASPVEASRLSDEATAHVLRAFSRGWSDPGLVITDPDLAPLRSRADFTRAVSRFYDLLTPADPFARPPSPSAARDPGSGRDG